MRIIPGWGSSNYVARFGIFLTIAALIVGMTGCGDGGNVRYRGRYHQAAKWGQVFWVRNELAELPG